MPEAVLTALHVLILSVLMTAHDRCLAHFPEGTLRLERFINTQLCKWGNRAEPGQSGSGVCTPGLCADSLSGLWRFHLVQASCSHGRYVPSAVCGWSPPE